MNFGIQFGVSLSWKRNLYFVFLYHLLLKLPFLEKISFTHLCLDQHERFPCEGEKDQFDHQDWSTREQLIQVDVIYLESQGCRDGRVSLSLCHSSALAGMNEYKEFPFLRFAGHIY